MLEESSSSVPGTESQGQPPDSEAGPRLVVGLGNPGEKYRDTRHNYGFLVIDEMASRLELTGSELCSSAYFSAPSKNPTGPRVHLAKPQTFMNRSGLSVRCLAQRFDLHPGNVLVVYDDVDLPFTKQRLRPGGSAAGHRGLESVMENLRTDRVPRLRLGIAPETETASFGQDTDLAEYVLDPFDARENQKISDCVRWAADACEAWLRYGIDRTMNQFNGSLPVGND